MSEQDSPGGSVASTPHRKSVNKKRKLPDAVKELATKELTQAYCVLLELLKGYKTFRNPPDIFAKNMVGYYEVVKEPMWLDEMRRKFETGDYEQVSQFASDMRLLLENCYHFFGPNNIVTKRALKLEHAYVECVCLLPKDLQSQFSLMNDGVISGTADGMVGEDYKSVLLEQITLQQKKEAEEHKRKVEEQLVLADENKDIVNWEREVLVSEDKQRQINGMWELPLIGQFVYLALDALNMDEISMYEVERMLLMPRASVSLARLVTSLLVSPMLRQRLVHLPPMSYHMWSRRLRHRVASWYRTYVKNDRNPVKTFELTGVETELWKILGEKSPLEEQEFHELSFHQRVWILKSLCDCCLHNQSAIYERVCTSEVRDAFKHHLGNDRNDFRYEHLPELCGDDLRVYRQAANSLSLIERDEAYWESIATNTPHDGSTPRKVTKATEEDGGGSDTCSNDSRDHVKVRRGDRTRSTESDSGLSCNSSDTRQCDDSSTEPSQTGSIKILSRHHYIGAAADRQVYNPHWLSPEGSGFEIVADSYESLTELILKLGGGASDQRLCNAKNTKKKIPKCEVELLRELQILANNLKSFEVEFITCMKMAREKMYKEWLAYQKRPAGFVDPGDAIWSLSADQHDMIDDKGDYKSENSVGEVVGDGKETVVDEEPEQKAEEIEGRERYSRRAKRKVDSATHLHVVRDDALLMQDTLDDNLEELLGSDTEDYEEEALDDDDDVWEMPGKKKKVSKPKTPGRKPKLAVPENAENSDGVPVTPKHKTPGRKPKVAASLNAEFCDGSPITPKPKKSSGKKIAKMGTINKNASRKLFSNQNTDVSVIPVMVPPEEVAAATCERVQNASVTAPQLLCPTVNVKKEEDVTSCTENLELKQEIKEEPEATVKQECPPVPDNSCVLPTPDTRHVEFQQSSVPMLVYQAPQVNAFAGASSVIIGPILASVPFSSPDVVASSSQVQTSVPTSQVQMPMVAPTPQVCGQQPASDVSARQTVLQRAGGAKPVVSTDVICLDSDSSDSDVEFVGDVKHEQKPQITTPVTPGRISFVPEHKLKNEVTPSKNVSHPLNTLQMSLDKRLIAISSDESPQEVGQRLSVLSEHQSALNPPSNSLAGSTNIHFKNFTPTHSAAISNLQQDSPPSFGKGSASMSSFLATPKKQSSAYPTSAGISTPPGYSNSPRAGAALATFSPRGAATTATFSPRGGAPSAATFSPRGGSASLVTFSPRGAPSRATFSPRGGGASLATYSPRGGVPSAATFSPSMMQWNSPRSQCSPRPATRGRGLYATQQSPPVRGQSGAGRGRASPLQPVASSAGARTRLFQQDSLAGLSGSLPIVGDVDHTTGSFRYALVMSNGNRIPLTSDQVEQIRKGNGGMLPSSL